MFKYFIDHKAAYLGLDRNIDIFIPPDAGPELGHRHLSRDHAGVGVTVIVVMGRGGRGGERGRRRGQVIIATVHTRLMLK